MRVKAGVLINGIKPETLFALMVTQEIFNTLLPGKEMTTTSIVDGVHSAGSKHYIGYAFDLRDNTLSTPEKASLVSELKARLTAEYDVIQEATHIHVEFDPKRAMNVKS